MQGKRNINNYVEFFQASMCKFHIVNFIIKLSFGFVFFYQNYRFPLSKHKFLPIQTTVWTKENWSLEVSKLSIHKFYYFKSLQPTYKTDK